MINPLFRIPLGVWIEAAIDFLTEHLSFITKALSEVMETVIDAFVDLMLMFHPIIFILIVVVVLVISKRRAIAFGSFLGFFIIWNLGLWEAMLSTITLVVFATFIAVMIGLPLGIWAGLSNKAFKVISPVLDFMQTMPAFVYLIPAIPFFGLGPVSAIFATVIFAIPPTIRLTALGIRQVPKDLVEACDSFGSTTVQKLIKVQLPIALPTIMAGINQTIMLSLSMVVVAAMIGAKGLGGEVWKAIQRFKPGMGFEAGLGVVIVAMILDRISQSFSAESKKKRKGEL